MSLRTRTSCGELHTFVIAFVLFLTGCGGGGGGSVAAPATPAPKPTTPDFALTLAPSVLSVPEGGSAAINVTATALNGFSENVEVTISDIPAGVAVSATSLTIGPNLSKAIIVTPRDTAAFNLTFSATSGTLAHQYSISARTVNPSVGEAPLRTTFLDIGFATYNFVNGVTYPGWKIALYDPIRKLFFASVTFGNQVVAISPRTGTIIARIPVPQPFGMDLSLDGSKLYVSTGTHFMYSIDLAKLQVSERIDMSTWGGQGYAMVQPLALAGGKIGFLEDLEGGLCIWEPADNSVECVARYIWAAVRNHDGTKIAFSSVTSPSSAGIYDVLTDSSISKSFDHGIMVVGFHPARDQFLTIGGMTSNTHAALWDEQMNIVRDYTPAQGNEPSNIDFSSGFFSRDGSTIYLENGLVLDTETFQPKGFVQFLDPSRFYLACYFQDIDESGLAIGASHQGIVLNDVRNIFQQRRYFWYLDTDRNARLSGPVSGGTSLIQRTTSQPERGSLEGTKVFFGPIQAPFAQATYEEGPAIKVSSTTPPNAPGPVNVGVYFPDGSMTMGASAFTYGPDIRNLTFTAATAEGGPAAVYGYGLIDGATVLVGGHAAIAKGVNPGSVYTPGWGSKIEYRVPPGTPGKADFTVQTEDGERTYAGAFHYYPATQWYPKDGRSMSRGIYDASRKLIYFTGADRVHVFSPASGNWLSPIPLPAYLLDAAVSPNAGYMAFINSATMSLIVIDLSSRTVVREISIRPDTTNPAQSSMFALVFASETEVITAVPSEIRRVDVISGNLVWRKSLASGWIPPNLTRSRPALLWGRYLLLDNGLYLDLAEPAPLELHGWGCILPGPDTFAISRDGKISQGDCILNSEGLVTGVTYTSDAEFWSLEGDPVFIGGRRYGQLWDATGTYILQPNYLGIDVIHAGTGAVRERITTPLSMPGDLVPMVLDPDEQKLFIITDTGIAAIDLRDLPLGIASVSPASATSGTPMEVRGAGFTLSTQVFVDGKPVEAVLVDSSTLQFTAPQHDDGPVQLMVKSADGSRDFLDAAFVYDSASQSTGAQTLVTLDPMAEANLPTALPSISRRPKPPNRQPPAAIRR